MTSGWQIMTSSSLLQFMVGLEQTGTQILDTWSMIYTFLLKATFCLTKSKKRTKKSLTQLSHY